MAAARRARSNSYAPYSGFRVGAAVLDSAGRIHPGVNVENAAYGLTVCAERNALGRAVAEGAKELVAIAIVGPEDETPLMPCGSCRQVLWEHAPELTVVVAGEDALRRVGLGALLPEAFGAGAFGPSRR